MVDVADVETLRQAQIDTRTLFVSDLLDLWESLDLARPEPARDALLAATPLLVNAYSEAAAAVAADWYDEARAAERVPGRFRAAVVVPDETVAVQRTVRRAAGALFAEAVTTDAFWVIAGRAAMYVLEGPRQTITTSAARDPRASGWQRVTRPGACRFCRMLAGRGAVYKEATAHFAAHGGAKGGECNCTAVPSWDPDAPEVDVHLYEASRRTSLMTPEQRDRHNYAVQRAMDEYVPD